MSNDEQPATEKTTDALVSFLREQAAMFDKSAGEALRKKSRTVANTYAASAGRFHAAADRLEAFAKISKERPINVDGVVDIPTSFLAGADAPLRFNVIVTGVVPIRETGREGDAGPLLGGMRGYDIVATTSGAPLEPC